MATFTCRPTTLVGSSGDLSIVPSGTAVSVLADNSDGTYTNTGSANSAYLELDFGNPGVTAGYRVKEARLRVRTEGVGVSLRYIRVFGYGGFGDYYINSITPTTYEIARYTINSLPTTRRIRHDPYGGPAAGGSNIPLFASYLDIIAVAPMTLTVTSPAATVTQTTTPTSRWSIATIDGDGGFPTGVQVKIFDSATYGGGGFNPSTSTPAANSGTIPYVNEWESNTSLPDGTYRTYVRAKQTVNGQEFWGTWAFLQWTLSANRPANPTISTTVFNNSGAIKLSVASGGGGPVSTDFLEVQRSTDGGTTWEYVRGTVDGGLVAIGAIPSNFADYEAPNGTPMKYRVRALHEFSEGNLSASSWITAAGSPTWSSTDSWLKHPTDPASNLRLVDGRIMSYSTRAKAARQTSFQPLGASSAVVVSDTRAAETGEIDIRLDTLAEQQEMDALLEAVCPLLLQFTAEDRESAAEEDRWIMPGDATRERVFDKASVPYKTESLPWVDVPRPSGVITSFPTLT